MTTSATPSPYTATQTQLREIAMSLFNVDLRREAVKNAQSVGTALAERVNQAAWKTYLPALIDLLVNVLRDPATEYKDRLASILGENKVTVNDLIAIMAAAKSQIAQYGRDSESMGGFLIALCADVEQDETYDRIIGAAQYGQSLYIDAYTPSHVINDSVPETPGLRDGWPISTWVEDDEVWGGV